MSQCLLGHWRLNGPGDLLLNHTKMSFKLVYYNLIDVQYIYKTLAGLRNSTTLQYIERKHCAICDNYLNILNRNDKSLPNKWQFTKLIKI